VTFILGSAAVLIIIFLAWRLSVVSSERDDALTERDEWQVRWTEHCRKLAYSHELQQDAIREAQDYLAPQHDDPDDEWTSE
jgi:hypothetical protein